MKVTRIYILLSILVGLVSACRSPEPAGLPTPLSGGQPSEADVTNPVLVLRRSGGITGAVDEWQIFADGQVLVRQGENPQTTLQIPPQAVSELTAWLENSDFYTAQVPTPNPDETCCDRFLYELTASANGKTNTVVVLDTPQNLPGNLPEAFRRVSNLLGVQL